MRNADPKSVLRHFAIALVLTFCMKPLQGATLERLSLEDMIAQSTSIVRGKVVSSFGLLHGPLIYTHYQVRISERYKGNLTSSVELIVPGGAANGLRQDVAGAPQLNPGDEYVLFLWTGRSGATQIIGLTQGLFAIPKSSDNDPEAVRDPSTELMLDRGTGQAVKDQRLSMRLSDLKSRIAGTLKTTQQGASQ